ncbi:hypothetical protein PG993_008020 [Apiospora rasikravindrae]|uniref:Uncharacterized protein n=1 Tax=Apiospora rasikravindrae TaxID=990691 RepID=A0ABR1SZ52_9PEZI
MKRPTMWDGANIETTALVDQVVCEALAKSGGHTPSEPYVGKKGRLLAVTGLEVILLLRVDVKAVEVMLAHVEALKRNIAQTLESSRGDSSGSDPKVPKVVRSNGTEDSWNAKSNNRESGKKMEEKDTDEVDDVETKDPVP